MALLRCQKRVFPEIRAVQVSQNFPYIMMNGNVHHYDTTDLRIYYYKNKILVSPSYYHDILAGGELVKTEFIWYYFVFEKNSKFGYLTNKNTNLINVKCSVDSFLNKQFAFSNNYMELFNKFNPTLLSEKHNKKEEIIYKTYTFSNGDKDSLGNFCIDTLIMGFSKKMMDSDFSFSRELDSIHKMKLISLTAKGVPRYYPDKKFFLNSRIELNFFNKIEVENKEEIMKYFNVE